MLSFFKECECILTCQTAIGTWFFLPQRVPVEDAVDDGFKYNSGFTQQAGIGRERDILRSNGCIEIQYTPIRDCGLSFDGSLISG